MKNSEVLKILGEVHLLLNKICEIPEAEEGDVTPTTESGKLPKASPMMPLEVGEGDLFSEEEATYRFSDGMWTMADGDSSPDEILTTLVKTATAYNDGLRQWIRVLPLCTFKEDEAE